MIKIVVVALTIISLANSQYPSASFNASLNSCLGKNANCNTFSNAAEQLSCCTSSVSSMNTTIVSCIPMPTVGAPTAMVAMGTMANVTCEGVSAPSSDQRTSLASCAAVKEPVATSDCTSKTASGITCCFTKTIGTKTENRCFGTYSSLTSSFSTNLLDSSKNVTGFSVDCGSGVKNFGSSNAGLITLGISALVSLAYFL